MIPEKPIHKKPPRTMAAIARTATTAAVAVAVSGALLLGTRERLKPPPPVPAEVVRAVLPDGVRFQDLTDPVPHFAGADHENRSTGVVVLTDTLAPSINGYFGQVGTAVGITPAGRIVAVRPFRHRETPYYMEMVVGSGLLEQMAGIDMAKPFPDLDAVSGATVTSRAIIEDVRLAAARAARTLYSVEVPEPEARRRGSIPYWKEVLLAAALLLAFLAGSMGEGWFRRYGIGLLTLAVVGFILNTPMTLSTLSRIFQTRLPGTGNGPLLLVFLYILISSPLQGRSYCRYVCPFGTLQQLVHRLTPFQISVPSGVNAWLPAFRRAFTALLLILGAWAGLGGFTEAEPFFGLFSLDLAPLPWVMVVFILMVSAFWRRFWCNAMCPTGTLLALLCRAARPRKESLDENV